MEYQDKIDILEIRNKRYKQTLQEIKAIAENMKFPHCSKCNQILNKRGKCTSDCGADYREQIIQKITKTEEE